jgi:trehalose 6-phosphate phosphatase
VIEIALTAALRGAARRRRLLVASDYDGTLSPIIDDPSAAVPLERAVEALGTLAEIPGVHAAIISGRSPETLRALAGAAHSVTMVGSHGAQAAEADNTDALNRLAKAFDGAVVEPKPLGAAFHYRHVAPAASAQAADAARQIGSRLGARIIEGKKVVEIVIGDGDKGSAIAQMRDRWSVDCVVFFGDDVTDEDAFSSLGSDDIGVKVGPGDTSAGYRVDSPAQVAEALVLLLAERRAFVR